MIFTFATFLGMLFSGAPVVFALGIASALILITTTNTPLSLIALRIYAGLDSFPLMAIPFFVFAGLVMEKGGIARCIIDLALSLVGWVRGSLYYVAILGGSGLSAISGSGSADTAAIASMLTPEMKRRNYDSDYSAAIVAAAGALGPIIPPSIMMVVFAMVANLSVGAMFLGGIVPGILMAIGMIIVSYFFARHEGNTDRQPFAVRNVAQTAYRAVPALTLPFIIVGGIVGGFVTPTEAACLAVIVGLFVSFFVYKELSLSDLPQMVIQTGAISAAVMMIIATASVFSWIVASQNVPGLLGDWLQSVSNTALLYLLIVNILLLIVGMFMESVASILILAPILMPIAARFGIDPTHFAVVVCLNLSIGFITPPYGVCLYVASTITGRSVSQVSRRIWIPLIPMIGVLLLSTYIPELILWLPGVLMK